MVLQVSIHTPTWGVTQIIKPQLYCNIKFQSTHLHEVWLFCPLYHGQFWPVSIHTPTWGVTPSGFDIGHHRRFQSTHLHEVWRISRFLAFRICVSIHTPTWGVTVDHDPPVKVLEVSIHTPTWGVTKDEADNVFIISVSIHTPTWGVTLAESRTSKPLLVSIHTPTWGVTWSAFKNIKCYRCFNPHTYMRCDSSPDNR